MSSVPIGWINYDTDSINRGMWDQGLLELLFAGKVWNPVKANEYEHFESFEDMPLNKGGIIVLPARYHADHIEKLNYQLNEMPWVLLILTSDEESLFPWRLVDHPRMKMWVMTPRPGLHDDFPGRFLGEYFREDCPSVLRRYRREAVERRTLWYFSGQITHPRRVEMVEAVMKFGSNEWGDLNQTAGFTQGYQYDEYLRRMASAKIALAPSGPGTPDSFRLYEALEAGCVPIVDASSPGGPTGYWDMMFPDRPFPVLSDWKHLPSEIARIMEDWEGKSAECSAWWQNHKRDLAYSLVDDVRELRDS